MPYSLLEAAKILNCSPMTVRRYVQGGGLEATSDARGLRIESSTLEAFAARRTDVLQHTLDSGRVADLLRVSKRTVHRLVLAGKLQAIHEGGSLHITRLSLAVHMTVIGWQATMPQTYMDAS